MDKLAVGLGQFFLAYLCAFLRFENLIVLALKPRETATLKRFVVPHAWLMLDYWDRKPQNLFGTGRNIMYICSPEKETINLVFVRRNT
jgi:hypothetical protein